MPQLVRRRPAPLAISVPTAAIVTPTATPPPTRARPARCAIPTASAWTPTRAAGSGATSSTAASRACPRRRSRARSTRRTERCRCPASTCMSRRPPSIRLTEGAVCNRCGDALPGTPISPVITDSSGHFTLTAVPSGDDIPLVITSGKWRRQITIPTVNSCADNPLAAADTRLPKTQSEGRHAEDRDHDRQRRLARVPDPQDRRRR